MRNGLKLIVITLPLALIGAGVLAWFITGKTPPPQEARAERAVMVRTLSARPMTMTPRIIGYGFVQPAMVWTAIAQVSGEVVAIAQNFDKGAVLPAGTEIVRLSAVDFNLAIAQAEANIRSAKARLDELAIGEQNTRASLAFEEQSLALTEAELARSKELLDREVIAQAVLDKVAASAVAQRQKLAGVKNTLALIPTQRTVLEEQIAVYRVNLESAKLNLKRTSIVLPFDSRVADAATELGQLVKSGQTVGIFDQVGGAEIETQLAIARFRTLLDAAAGGDDGGGFGQDSFSKLAEQAGFSAEVRLRMGDDYIKWPGEVVRISDAINTATGTLGVVVFVEDAYGGARTGEKPPLTKGMFVEVELRTRPVAGAILIPRAALHGGKIYVAGTDDRLHIRPVQTGLEQGDFVVVTRGLAAGEKVIVSQPGYAIEGMALNPVDDEALAARLAAQAAGGVRS